MATTHERTAEEILKGGKQVLLEILHFSDQEWIEWVTSDLVRPYWLELWNDYLLHQGQTKRGVGLALVQETIIKGEGRGNGTAGAISTRLDGMRRTTLHISYSMSRMKT